MALVGKALHTLFGSPDKLCKQTCELVWSDSSTSVDIYSRGNQSSTLPAKLEVDRFFGTGKTSLHVGAGTQAPVFTMHLAKEQLRRDSRPRESDLRFLTKIYEACGQGVLMTKSTRKGRLCFITVCKEAEYPILWGFPLELKQLQLQTATLGRYLVPIVLHVRESTLYRSQPASKVLAGRQEDSPLSREVKAFEAKGAIIEKFEQGSKEFGGLCLLVRLAGSGTSVLAVRPSWNLLKNALLQCTLSGQVKAWPATVVREDDLPMAATLLSARTPQFFVRPPCLYFERVVPLKKTLYLPRASWSIGLTGPCFTRGAIFVFSDLQEELGRVLWRHLDPSGDLVRAEDIPSRLCFRRAGEELSLARALGVEPLAWTSPGIPATVHPSAIVVTNQEGWRDSAPSQLFMIPSFRLGKRNRIADPPQLAAASTVLRAGVAEAQSAQKQCMSEAQVAFRSMKLSGTTNRDAYMPGAKDRFVEPLSIINVKEPLERALEAVPIQAVGPAAAAAAQASQAGPSENKAAAGASSDVQGKGKAPMVTPSTAAVESERMGAVAGTASLPAQGAEGGQEVRAIEEAARQGPAVEPWTFPQWPGAPLEKEAAQEQLLDLDRMMATGARRVKERPPVVRRLGDAVTSVAARVQAREQQTAAEMQQQTAAEMQQQTAADQGSPDDSVDIVKERMAELLVAENVEYARVKKGTTTFYESLKQTASLNAMLARTLEIPTAPEAAVAIAAAAKKKRSRPKKDAAKQQQPADASSTPAPAAASPASSASPPGSDEPRKKLCGGEDEGLAPAGAGGSPMEQDTPSGRGAGTQQPGDATPVVPAGGSARAGGDEETSDVQARLRAAAPATPGPAVMGSTGAQDESTTVAAIEGSPMATGPTAHIPAGGGVGPAGVAKLPFAASEVAGPSEDRDAESEEEEFEEAEAVIDLGSELKEDAVLAEVTAMVCKLHVTAAIEMGSPSLPPMPPAPVADMARGLAIRREQSGAELALRRQLWKASVEKVAELACQAKLLAIQHPTAGAGLPGELGWAWREFAIAHVKRRFLKVMEE